jgi:hypothetical protein
LVYLVFYTIRSVWSGGRPYQYVPFAPSFDLSGYTPYGITINNEILCVGVTREAELRVDDGRHKCHASSNDN